MNAKLLDVVRLTDSRRGTIVEVYGNGEAFEVEFLDGEGRTTSVETVESSRVADIAWSYQRRGKPKAA